MQDLDESEYFQRRAEEERAAAERAEDDRAAQSHRALAMRYERKASEEPMDGANEPGNAGTAGQEFRIIP